LALFTNREKWGFSPWRMPFFLACMVPKIEDSDSSDTTWPLRYAFFDSGKFSPRL